METQMVADMFQPGSWWILSKMPRQRICRPPHKCTQRTILDSGILGRKEIHNTHIWLGIQGKKSPTLHTRLCRNSDKVFPPKNTNKTIISTVPTYTTKLWRTAAVHQTRRRGVKAERTRKNVCPASDRNVPVLCKSGVYHNFVSTQCHIIITVKYNKHNNEKSEKVPKLCGITPRCNIQVLCKCHDIGMS